MRIELTPDEFDALTIATAEQRRCEREARRVYAGLERDPALIRQHERGFTYVPEEVWQSHPAYIAEGKADRALYVLVRSLMRPLVSRDGWADLANNCDVDVRMARWLLRNAKPVTSAVTAG